MESVVAASRQQVGESDGRPAPLWTTVQCLWDGRWREGGTVTPDRNGVFEATCPPPAAAWRLHWQYQEPVIEILDWYGEPFRVKPGEVLELPIQTLRREDAKPVFR